MKSLNSIYLALFMLITTVGYAQLPELQFYRENGKVGLNQFETSKENTVEFDGVKVRVGGDFAIQMQGLSQSNDLVGDTLVELSSNFNLPAANLNLDVQFADGVRMHLRTYLSSRHHEEAWVKGGHLQLDNLDFINEGFLAGVMEIVTLRFGMDQINYGDAHFRRSDNAAAIYNPFVGNYIMDAFTTEPFGEITVQKNGLIGVVGFSNGRLNQSPEPGDDGLVSYGKLGFDKQMNDDLRFRITGSWYMSSDSGTRDYLYAGDRAGARYYRVMNAFNDMRVADFEPRFNPRFDYRTSIQVNPFVKFKGAELFGVYEMTSNGDSEVGGEFSQIGAELIYRFFEEENVYIGGRYNSVTGKMSKDGDDMSTDRINVGGGWFLTNNILVKVEYVMQKWEDAGYDGTKYQGAEFDGVVLEAVIGF
ncbi:MAG: hypothetical protein HKO93_04435 [Flavobacteriales bacterium]|nr:hypothetical protein [Flavobacteriales bacterium]